MSVALTERKPWAAMAALSIGFFVCVLDMTIINIALPSISASFNVKINESLWVVNIYILIMASCVLFAGKIGGRLGFKYTFQIGMLMFLLGSLSCSLSPSLTYLVFSRALQALGAAFLIPQILSIIKQTFPEYSQPWAFGIWSATGGIAAIVGPTLGGIIVSEFTWKVIFLINIPISLIVIVMINFFVKEEKDHVKQSLDFFGILLSFLLLISFSILLMNWNVNKITVNCIFLMFIILLTIALAIQQKLNQHKSPIIPFNLLKSKNYLLLIFIILLNAFSVFSLTVVVSLYFQEQRIYSALYTGLLIAPASLLSTIVSFGFSSLIKRFKPALLLLSGLFITFLCCFFIALQYIGGQSFIVSILIMSILGIGNGLAVPSMNTLAMKWVDKSFTGSASGLLNTFRQTGMLIASAIISFILSFKLHSTNIILLDSYLFCFFLPVFSSFLGFSILLLNKFKGNI